MRRYVPKEKNLPERFRPDFLRRLDGRLPLVARLTTTFARVVEDAGGPDAMGYAKLALVERFCWMEEFLRQIEAELAEGAAGKDALLGRWTQMTNALVGLAKVVGVPDRQPKDFIDVTLYKERPPSTPQAKPGDDDGGDGENPPDEPEPTPKAKPGRSRGKDVEDEDNEDSEKGW